MAINLQKGQKIDLTKGNDGLNNIMVGLGWDPIKKPTTFWSNLLGSSQQEIDCDASVLMLNSEGKLRKLEDVVYYDQLVSLCGNVRHMGDNTTGEGEGDDEQILITLNKIPIEIHSLIFVVNIYDCEKRKQDFGLITNAFIRIINADSNQELCKFNLTENYTEKTALIVGELYRHNSEWKFSAIGEATKDKYLIHLVRRYQ